MANFASYVSCWQGRRRETILSSDRAAWLVDTLVQCNRPR